MIFWKIDDPNQIPDRLGHFEKWLRTEYQWDRPITWEPKPYTNPRSLSANALMHVWFREMANKFSTDANPLTEEQMKALMVHKFLGTEDVVISKTVIEGQLRHTSKLTSGECKQFMDQVSAWAADHGCVLTMPEDSEYMQWSKES